ncbi:MAG TPA: chemotaxis protein CheW [Methylophaga sp.]|nr:chemotaxis protein CheW [Methylophaga sp.]
MTAKLDYVHCMLIPLRQHYLLLPNTTIAEVIPLPRQIISAQSNQQNFIVGQVHWRDSILPVIDLENLIDEPADADSRAANKLCIVNGINDNALVDHYALPCCGAPQLITLNEAALQTSAQADVANWLHCQIKIGNKTALIPNLDDIESHLQNQLAMP